MSGFAAATLADLKARGAVTVADVQALSQAYSDGQQLTLETARLLIDINASARELDVAWTACFVDAVTDFLVLQWDPIGYLTVEKSEWIMAALTAHVATGCVPGAKAEMELLIGLLSLSRWSPQTLAAFALNRHMTGPIRAGLDATVTGRDVEMLRRVLYAYGHDDSIAMTRIELNRLADIGALAGKGASPEWAQLFQKALFDGVLSMSGYAAASREQMLSPDPIRDDGVSACDWTRPYRRLSSEERAIARLERQKVEIVTHEAADAPDAAWFATLCDRPEVACDLQAVMQRLADSRCELAPEIAAAADRCTVAA
jgi:hypothetical protein